MSVDVVVDQGEEVDGTLIDVNHYVAVAVAVEVHDDDHDAHADERSQK